MADSRVNGRIEKVPETKEDNWVWSPQGQIDMHLPANWGYVQFEQSPSKPPLRKDPPWAARMQLEQVFEAQLAFRKEPGRWAATPIEYRIRS